MSMNKRPITLATTLAKSFRAIERLERLHPELSKETNALTHNIINVVMKSPQFAVNSEIVSQAEIDALLRGNKVGAIKACRERTGKGLYDAKVYIEQLIDSTPAYKAAYNNYINGANRY